MHLLARASTAVLALFFAGAAAAAQTRVVMLGTGTPNADPERSGPSLAIVVNGASYLVDAGPGVVRRAALAQRTNDIAALAPPKLRRVFLTHLHSDHTAGLPDLLLTPWVLERTDPLEVYGPPGTQRMMNLISQAYDADIQIRLNGGEPSNKTGYRANARDVSPGLVYRDSNVTVTAFAVAHGKWEHAYGYIFQTRDRKIVVSGDTGPTDAVIKACDGCDLLVHEVYSAENLPTRPPVWQTYHKAYHTSGYQVGDVATKARAKAVLLTHQLYWGGDDVEIIREVATRYAGVIFAGRDGTVY